MSLLLLLLYFEIFGIVVQIKIIFESFIHFDVHVHVVVLLYISVFEIC